MSAEVLALILARGGSKSVPRKNLLPVAGKPLIAYSIGHALAAESVTRIVVSTDDDEIAQVAEAWGAEVPFRRPAALAQDNSTDLEGFAHALSWLDDNEGYRPELVVHLRATGPVRDPQHVDQAVERMLAHPDADSLRSVSVADQTPYKMWRIDGSFMEPALTVDGLADAHSMPRQILPQIYWQNGYVDVVRPRTVLELGSMVGQRVLPFIVDGPVVDLDYPEQIPALERAVLAARGGRLPRARELARGKRPKRGYPRVPA